MYFFQPNDGMFGALFLSELGENSFRKYDRLTIYVAYAKYSGVARIAEALESFVAASGKVETVVGINQQQTTYEAIDLLLRLGSEVRIFYDEDDNKTFHPKVYWLQNSRNNAQWVAIGSNNLTAGGLYLNYEMAVVSSNSAATREDAAQSAALRDVLRSYEASGHLLSVNDKSTLDTLLERGYLTTESEVKAKRQQQRSSAQRAQKEGERPLFPRSAAATMPSIPERLRLARPTGTASAATGASGERTTTATAASSKLSPQENNIAAAGVEQRRVSASPNGFWKRLSPSDVSLTSSPGQMIIPRQFLSFFPPLGSLKTTRSGGKQGDALIDVEYRQPNKEPMLVKGARVIWYEPAPDHPRQNPDLRFTFRNREVLTSLEAGDVLEFVPTAASSPALVVRRIPASAAQGSEDYGLIV